MRSLRVLIACGLALALLALAPTKARGEDSPPEVWSPDRPWEVVDLAFVLDTSGSMHWLIDTARSRFWSIVHDLSRLEPTPIVRVAVVTYGNRRNDADTGWVRVETDLTEDLDLVYERLSGLSAGGKTEYVARAVREAGGLSWTRSDEALRMIFLAGNETADQDPVVDLRAIADDVRHQDIFVHALFCGGAEHEAAGSWMDLAELTGGRFATIESRFIRDPETPFDEEIARLSAAVNATFLPMGEDGRHRVESLAEQDRRAEDSGAAATLSRALVKTSSLYSSRWDLVGALDAGAIELESLDVEALPEPLREMNVDERVIAVEDMGERRRELAMQLSELEERRRRHLARMESGEDHPTLDTTVRETLKEKLEKKGFRRRDR